MEDMKRFVLGLSLMTWLVACPSPTPTINVNPKTQEVTAGATPITINATVTNASSVVIWSLTGPGSISPTTAASTKYTPPAANALQTQATATITARLQDGSALSDTATLTLKPAPGSLTVTIQAPSGVQPSVVVTGPAGFSQTLTATQTLSLPAGTYAVVPATVRKAAPIVDQLYTASAASVALTSGGTASSTINYAQRKDSAALWISGASNGEFAGYASNNLVSTTEADALATVNVGTTEGLAIDRDGNVWVGSDNKLLKFTPAQLTTATPTPDVTITPITTDAENALFEVRSLAFDQNGNLWAGSLGTSSLVRLARNQLTSSGSPQASVIVSVPLAPTGIAFDASGNLWFSSFGNDSVSKLIPSQLAADASVSPVLTLSSSSVNGPSQIAFDSTGNLWVANYSSNNVTKFSTTQLALEGEQTLEPAVVITNNGSFLEGASGLAFDNAGDLWVSNDNIDRSLVRFNAAGLTATSELSPSVVMIGVTDVSYGQLQFSPPAANLPLYR
jgi:sugar lactone lactonase YvrE